jgi:hypothetical protein
MHPRIDIPCMSIFDNGCRMRRGQRLHQAQRGLEMTTQTEQSVPTLTVNVHVRPKLLPKIQCEPRWLNVMRPEGIDKSVMLSFKLVPPVGEEEDYTFPVSGGIVIVNDAFPYPCGTTDEQPDPLPSSNITEVRLLNVNLRDAEFTYTVKVLHRDGKSYTSLTEDPYIRNGQ